MFTTKARCILYCVVPENIHTPTTEGIGNSRGVGGSKAQEIPEGMGGWRRNLHPDGRKSIDSLQVLLGATYLLYWDILKF